MSYKFDLSVVVPLFNEEQNVVHLHKAISKALQDVNAEIIFVDDGSFDTTANEVLQIEDANLKLVKFTRNYGQTSAMAAGIEHAVGEYIVTLDGDLQNDPSDIPVMLNRIKKENLDLITGRRRHRKDGLWFRKIPSRIANILIRKSTGVHISDIGCSLKIFKAEIAKKLELYGELHRFIPILASMHGAKIAEVDVKHHARKYGSSKYGISRTVRVLSDLMLMLFFIRYRQRPMHLFGTIGQGFLCVGSLGFLYLTMIKIFGGDIGHRPLLIISIFLIIAGIQFLSTGFIAELLMRTYYAAEKRKPYNIAGIYVGGKKISEPNLSKRKD
ncbi:MAG: glycosyl transferase [Candidatus Midichloriaceae bacterium]|jgi:dolichol-phosphate mannosyltransferase|nr:glycosyl transferase [Candidatus Midichloriaceae bacterium]